MNACGAIPEFAAALVSLDRVSKIGPSAEPVPTIGWLSLLPFPIIQPFSEQSPSRWKDLLVVGDDDAPRSA